MKRSLSLLFLVTLFFASLPALHADPPTQGVLFGYVGQVTNSGANSDQYGNLTSVVGAPAGSFFTFYTTAVTDSVVVNGPLKIIRRHGTTTIYQASASGDFSTPDSFRSGVPVAISAIDQQVVVNTTNGSFTVINVNTILSRTSDAPLSLAGIGLTFSSVLTGQLNAGTPPPSGWFGGYATR